MFTRRRLLPVLAAIPAMPGLAHAAAAPALTPACSGAPAATPSQAEGPFFSPNSPLKRDFTADAPGTALLLAGLVLDRQCRATPGALIELWHADQNGAYDNRGYRLRGHQFTDEKGLWWFTTIVPALYPGRTRHYHVKVQRPGGSVLTTQLYFPDEPQNQKDGLFRKELQMRLGELEGGRMGRFDFIVQ